MQVYQPMNAGTHPHEASELSAFWEVAVSEEWKSLVACVAVRGPQANGALCSLKAEELRGPFCVRFLYCQHLPRRIPAPDLNPEQPFGIRAVPPEGGSVRSEPHGQFPNPTQVSTCCMHIVAGQTLALRVAVRKQGPWLAAAALNTLAGVFCTEFLSPLDI